MALARSVCLGGISGTALWTTLGTLDVHTSVDGLTRAAVLPGVERGLLFIGLATLIVATLTYLTRHPAAGALPRSPATENPGASPGVASPLGYLGILVFPYLPWLPDVAPIVTVLAGPLKWLVWAVILIETGRRLGASVAPDRFRSPGWSDAAVLGLLSVVLLLGSAAAAARLTASGTGLYPTGDEPHYLVMAQSLWRDADLRIENNHQRRDYAEYYTGGDLAPHYLARGIDGEIYSVHPVGLPMLLAPVYAVDGYRGVKAVLIAVSTAVGALLFVWLRRLRLPLGATLFGWCAVVSSASFIAFSFAVYPEMVAGLLVVSALLLVTTGSGRPAAGRAAGDWPWLGAGLAAAALPWLSTKYAPMALAILLVGMGRLLYPRRSSGASTWRRAGLLLVTPVALSLLGWLAFFRSVWGSFSPAAPYGSEPGTTLSHLPAGGPGLLFDQEYGLLVYAPVYALALTGLLTMWRQGGASRRLAGEIALVAGALVAAVGSFHIWWGGSAPPGRPIVSILPVLGMPIAWQYARLGTKPLHASLARALLVTSAGLTLLLVTAQQGFLLANDRDGSSALLEHLSPIWPLTQIAPSFITDPPLAAAAAATVWLFAGWGAAMLLPVIAGREPTRVAVSLGASLALLVALSLVIPGIRPTGPDRTTLIETRTRITLLDRFDSTTLPTGILFDPLRAVPADVLPPLFSFQIAPPRAVAASAALLYGRRLSLPAGQYRIQVSAGPLEVAGTLDLQVGRTGPPFEQWSLRLPPTQRWSTPATLHMDVGYVGLVAGPPVREAQPVISIVPAAVTDASQRPPPRHVEAALQTPQASYYFQTNGVHIQPRGFWTRRGRSASVVVARRDRDAVSAQSVRLRTRCGPVANTVVLASGDWQDTMPLLPTEQRDVEVPTRGDWLSLTVSAADGFVPAELGLDPADKRDLGCWVEVLSWR